MSELKFVCPICGQHMQCEKAYVGHKTNCPACSSEIRVPISSAPGGQPNALPRAELVAPAVPEAINPTAADPFKQSTPSHTSPTDIPQTLEIERERRSAGHAESSQPPEEPGPGVHCICPICKSELVVQSNSTADSTPRLAEVATPAKPVENSKPHNGPPDTNPLTEREKQIAVARGAHQVSLYPPMKPRLDYILGDKPESGPPDHPADGNQKSLNE